MNIKVEQALKYIDLGSYTKAVDLLKEAVNEETENNNAMEAIKYRCILGELYFQLEMGPQAKEELEAVMEYSQSRNDMKPQFAIAKKYLDIMSGKIPVKKGKGHPKDLPLMPKPIQNKAFITKQMSKKRR